MNKLIFFPITLLILIASFSLITDGDDQFNPISVDYLDIRQDDLQNVTMTFNVTYQQLKNHDYATWAWVPSVGWQPEPYYLEVHDVSFNGENPQSNGFKYHRHTVFVWQYGVHVITYEEMGNLLYARTSHPLTFVDNGRQYDGALYVDQEFVEFLTEAQWNNIKSGVEESGNDFLPSVFGFKFDIMGGIAILVAIVVAIFFLGVTVVGTGLTEYSQNLALQGFFYFGLWASLSIPSVDFISSVPIIGSVLWWLLTLIYTIGVISNLGGGE